MKPNDFLRQATQLVAGERNRQHGDKRVNHDNIAELWSAYLKRLTGDQELELGASDVATMMVLLKVARTLAGEFNEDDYVDMIGYAAIAGELAFGDADSLDTGKYAADLVHELRGGGSSI